MPLGRTSAKEVRDAGPVGQSFREAAVMLGVERDGQLVLIRRTPSNGVHSGQMALPGGRREAGESLLECALREWREELGLPGALEPLANPVALTEVHVVPSRFVVRPFIAPVELPMELQPDPREVASVHRVHWQQLIDPGNRQHQQVRVGGDHGFVMRAPGFAIEGIPFIWGATAMMLSEMAEFCSAWGHPLSP